MIKDWMMFVAGALMATAVASSSVESPKLPTSSAEIYALWVEGENYESEARELLRAGLNPTPMIGEDEYLGLGFGLCVAPDGGEYGVGWPVYTEQEKAMWERLIQVENPREAAGVLQGLIHGVQMLWDMVGMSDAVKENWLTKLKVVARDCFPPPLQA